MVIDLFNVKNNNTLCIIIVSDVLFAFLTCRFSVYWSNPIPCDFLFHVRQFVPNRDKIGIQHILPVFNTLVLILKSTWKTILVCGIG